MSFDTQNIYILEMSNLSIFSFVVFAFGVIYKKPLSDFPGGAVVKYLPANAGDMGSSPGSGRYHMPRSN